MSKSEYDSKEKDAFTQLIKVLEYNLKAFKSADSRQDVVELYEQLIKQLESINHLDFQKILSNRRSKKVQPRKKAVIMTDEEVLRLTNDDIKKIIDDKKTTRKTVEKIGALKFEMRQSELKSIRNKNSLGEHIKTIIRNKETHEAISRAATQNSHFR